MKTIPLFVLVVTAASALGQGGTQDVSPPAVTFDCSASKPQVIIETNSTGMFTEHMTWPWMALIGRKQGQDIDWVCPGMLINKQWVLTSALCIFDQSPMVVRLGEYDYDDDLDGADHQDFSVVENVTYPEYLGTQGYHSLMLVKLDSIVSFEKYISPVCLPWGEESNRNITDQKALLLTYGNRFSSGTRNTVQKEIELTVFPVALCDVNYSKLPSFTFKWPQGIGRETLCAGDPDGGKDACIGDSGGPLMTVGADGRYVVAGIVSSGYGCGIKEYPGLYNNLRYPPYLSWIKRIAFTTP